jgi:hypothetical protein
VATYSEPSPGDEDETGPDLEELLARYRGVDGPRIVGGRALRAITGEIDDLRHRYIELVSRLEAYESALRQALLTVEPVQVVLRDGTVLDGRGRGSG